MSGGLKIDWVTVAVIAFILIILIRGFDTDKLFGKDYD